MRRSGVLLAALVGVALSAHASSAQPPPDTIAVLSDATRPVLALEPATGIPHVAYVSGGTLYQAWKSGGVWQSEPVVSGVRYSSSIGNYGGYDLRIAPDGRVFALYNHLGTLECAIRTGGTWAFESLDALPAGLYSPVSLAVSPVTGEPTAAWAKAPATPGTPTQIWLARRTGGAWTAQQLDTVSSATRLVSVAVDFADRPRVAWGRPRGDDAPGLVLTCAIASGPAGPFVTAPLDSGLASNISVAADPGTGDPRIAYLAVGPGSQRFVRYAALASGTWQTTFVSYANTWASTALALDAAGDPFIANTFISFIEPQSVQAGTAATQCVFVSTGAVCTDHRFGGAGGDAFQPLACASGGDQFDAASGPRAIACREFGAVDIAWVSPGTISCGPVALSYTRQTPLAGVTPRPATRIGLQPITPNPARLGAALRVAFELDRTSDVTLELHDLAGRSVATRDAVRLAAGAQVLDWAPAAAHAGVYWLTLRGAGRQLGARPVVLVR